MVDSLGLCNLNLADQVVKTNLVKTNLVKTNLVLISRKVVKRLYRVQMVGMIFQTCSELPGALQTIYLIRTRFRSAAEATVLNTIWNVVLSTVASAVINC